MSAFFHAVLLAVLSICFAPAIREVGIWLSSATDPTDAIDVDDLSVRMDAEVNVPPPVADPLASVPEWPFLEGVPRSLEIAFQDLAVTPVGNQELVDDGGSLKRASSVEGAVDGITQAMRGVLREGDLSVVWLFDASNSLVDDRQRIAVRLESFLSDLAAGDSSDTSPRLLNTVVSFGSRMKELVRPTASRERVVDSIRDMPVDPSGIENVFAAIAQCVETYGASSQRHSLMLVVWTDESGDDAGKLEQVIRVCRGRDVAVHVVGPSAVLGADTGFHAYTDPKTDLEYLLPVTRGPDSPMEERIRLDYWFRTRSPLRGEAGERSLQLPAWYGGRDLAGISSGFSPYALTRLAVETGGTFTIFDKPSDRPPFDLDVLKDYLPHYGSAADYAARIELHPLRLAISQAVKVTRGRTQLSVPPLMLFGEESPIPPHRFEAPYLQPKQFASQLRTARAGLVRQADRSARLVDEALMHVSADGDINRGLDELYVQEDSPRWRAWYDLTRGRLLATSVRLEEYRLTCEWLADPEFLDDTTNFISFLASREMKSGEDFQRRSDEARRLLARCARQNKDTPWAYLAQRELFYAFGIAIRQQALQRIKGVPSRNQPSLPRY